MSFLLYVLIFCEVILALTTFEVRAPNKMQLLLVTPNGTG